MVPTRKDSHPNTPNTTSIRAGKESVMLCEERCWTKKIPLREHLARIPFMYNSVKLEFVPLSLHIKEIRPLFLLSLSPTLLSLISFPKENTHYFLRPEVSCHRPLKTTVSPSPH
jgi:hypothetical protein